MKTQMIKELIKKAYETSEVERNYLLPFEKSFQGNSLGKDEVYYKVVLGDVEEIITEEEYHDDAYNTQIIKGFFIPKRLGTIVKEVYERTFDGYECQVAYHIFTKRGWVEVEV